MKRIWYVLFVAALLVACKKEEPEIAPAATTGQGTDYPAGEYLLPLIETTDIHGYIVYQDNGTVHYRLAYIADKVNDIRGRGENYSKDRLLLLDGGDIYQGASISNLLDGKPLYMAMDKMDYDAVALGNHEFDWGLQNLVDADATLPDYLWEGQQTVNEVPLVCANLYQNGNRVSCTQDYVIVEKKATSSSKSINVRVAIIGYAVNYASSIMTSKFTGQGYSIREDYNAVNQLARQLESEGKCDATVLLIHGSAETAADNLGAGSPIDLVLGGHSHATQSGISKSGLSYLQGGRYGEYYASADLAFTVKEKNGKATFGSVKNQRIHTVDASKDLHTSAGQNAENLEADILDLSQKAVDEISAQSESVIGYITEGATTYAIAGSGGRSCAMANWMCDITRHIGDADVSFVNGGGVRTYFSLNGQARRDITVANVYEMFPFSNYIYIYNITYADLLTLLKYAMTDGGSALYTSMTGIDCYFNNNGAVLSLKKDGTVIFQNDQWTGDWAGQTLMLAVSEYLATTPRTDYTTGLPNPLIGWNSSAKLLSSDLLDNENAVRVLREEAAQTGGHLYIDTSTHLILQE